MNRDVVLGEWIRAVRTLSAAELLAREDYPEDAVARAYFAILHSAKAALLVKGIVAESHSAVFSTAEARRECSQARAFVGRIRQYLIECGFTASDLATVLSRS